MRYEVIFFDVDNTLFNFNEAEVYALEKTWTSFGYEYSEHILSTYQKINHVLWEALEQGKISLAELKLKRFKQLFETLEVDALAEEGNKRYGHYLSEASFEMEGAYEVCKTLSQKYKLALLTNGISEVQRSRLAHSRLSSFISEIIISEEVGVSKPNPEIFEEALRKMKIVDKRKALMVGDSLSADIQGSINAEIDVCWYNPMGKQTDLPIQYEVKDLVQLLEIC